MDTGVAIFPTHDAVAPADVARLAAGWNREETFEAAVAELHGE